MKALFLGTFLISTQCFAQDYYLGKFSSVMKDQKSQTTDAALEITKSTGESKFQFSTAQSKIKKWIPNKVFTLKETKPEKLVFGKFEAILMPQPSSGKSVVREGVTKTGKTTSLSFSLETTETEVVCQLSRLVNSKVVFKERFILKKLTQVEYEAQKKKLIQ